MSIPECEDQVVEFIVQYSLCLNAIRTHENPGYLPKLLPEGGAMLDAIADDYGPAIYVAMKTKNWKVARACLYLMSIQIGTEVFIDEGPATACDMLIGLLYDFGFVLPKERIASFERAFIAAIRSGRRWVVAAIIQKHYRIVPGFWATVWSHLTAIVAKLF